MSPRSKREYREAVHLRYKNASRQEKTAILDEFCATCGCCCCASSSYSVPVWSTVDTRAVAMSDCAVAVVVVGLLVSVVMPQTAAKAAER